MRRVALALALAGIVACSCGAGTVRTDRLRIFDIPGKPESEWGYDPARIEVSQGTTVAFRNAGSVLHTVTSDAPGRPFDVAADVGAVVMVRFDLPGTWTYHCGIHPAMKGVVQVCAGACR